MLLLLQGSEVSTPEGSEAAVDNPAAGAVIATSEVVTLPRRYRVHVVVASEANVWLTLAHHRGGSIVSSLLLPVTGELLGPVELYETYFAVGDYVELTVREGVPTVSGTIQANVELK